MKYESMKRRDVLKLLGAGGVAMMTGFPTQAEAEVKLSMPSSKKHAKIVIAGGGTAGMIAAARIRRAAPNAKIVMIAPNRHHLYQAGALFVTAGLADARAHIRKTTDLLPDGVTWLQEEVTAFDPDHNLVETSRSGKIGYDLLIVALGAAYDWERIEGLDGSMIGREGVASLYVNDTMKGEGGGSVKSRAVFAQLQEVARKSSVSFLCTEPDTPVKGAGTSLSLLFMGNSRLGKEKLNDRVRFTFARGDETLFPSEPYRKRLQREVERYDNIRLAYGFTLSGVDVGAKRAFFDTVDGKKTLDYDFLHVVPPHEAPKVVRESPLAIAEGKEKGWMAVEEGTLRHPTYKNVFGIGDVVGGTPGKSGGAAQHQGIVLQDNIAAALEEQPLPYRYDGYTVSPIVTREGRILLAEYNDKKPLPTLPLDPLEDRRLWWWFQKVLMPWLYFNMLMRGMM